MIELRVAPLWFSFIIGASISFIAGHFGYHWFENGSFSLLGGAVNIVAIALALILYTVVFYFIDKRRFQQTIRTYYGEVQSLINSSTTPPENTVRQHVEPLETKSREEFF